MQPSLSQLMQRFLARPHHDRAEGEVLPHDVESAFQVDPREAWQETLTTLKYLGHTGPLPEMPDAWPDLVRQQPTAAYLPMSPGNHPQQVRDLSLLLQQKRDPRLSSIPITEIKFNTNSPGHAAAMNHWQALRFDEAIKAWQSLPDSALKSFNLGLAYLKNENRDEAMVHLEAARLLLPEGSGWKVLAEFYLALAESMN